MSTFVIKTPRLILRPSGEEDSAPYAALNANLEVRRYWPGTLSPEDSDAEAARLRSHIDGHGFGFWAAEAPCVARFIGFVGLKHAPVGLPFAPENGAVGVIDRTRMSRRP